MKAGDNKEFWQRTAKSYGPFMKRSGQLYDAICERIRPSLTREMNVLELELAEIRRVLRSGGILYAPTFVHGGCVGFRLRTRLLTLAGFKVYSKWTAEGFEWFISEHNFQSRQSALLGGSLAPLCYLEANVKKCQVSGSIDGVVTPGAVAGRAEGSVVDGCAFDVLFDGTKMENAIGETTCMYESAAQ